MAETAALTTTRPWLFGTGRLRDAIAAVVTAPFPLALVAASDAWDTGRDQLRGQAVARGVGWLPVRTELSQVVIGPWEVPGQPGCLTCAESRRAWIRPDRAELAAVWHAHREQLRSRPAAWLTGLAAQLVGSVVAGELARVAAGHQPRTRNGLLRLDLAELAVTRHPFLPDPACPDCGRLPDDSPEAAELTLQPRRAHQPGSYRVRPIAAELDELVARYVDDQAGLVRSLDEERDGTQVVTRAPLGVRGFAMEGYGRSGNPRTSRAIALLEALERYGCSPADRRTVVLASYTEVSDRAVDPRTLGLHAPQQYAAPGFRFRPFDVDKPYRWVWGWSFACQQPILVPESCAYYGIPYDQGPEKDHDHGFVLEVSNGCALGGCLEEAILYGILEVAERDAFLLMWYARLAPPRVDLATATDPVLPLLAASIAAVSGLSVHVYDISVEQGIPCVCALAVNPDPGNGRPALALAAGSHVDPERAVRNALSELSPSLAALSRAFAAPGGVDRARALVEDPDLVRQMTDHAFLYTHPAAADRLDFLARSPRRATMPEVGDPERRWLTSDDLRENLVEAVSRYSRHGLDVVVVNQTSAEHRASGLHCVKVLIPGTLPMTFGHRHRRTHDLPRLFQVPKLLGYTDQPLTPADLNSYPHPFP
jgi:ribosomal protein S12 methylthiotransferase accessory factor